MKPEDRLIRQLADRSKGIRVLVCGGRHFDDLGAVWSQLATLHGLRGIALVIEGGASGADLSASQWANGNQVRCVTYRALWKTLGPAAGPIRNQSMIDEGKPDLVIAFPGGRGTADMVRRARAAGIEVIEVSPASGLQSVVGIDPAISGEVVVQSNVRGASLHASNDAGEAAPCLASGRVET